MKIWYGTIIVATIVLVGYLAIVVGQRLPKLSATVEESQANLKSLQEKLDKQADIKKLGKDANQPAKPAQEDKGKLAVDSLRTSLTKLSEADAKKQQGDINGAIDELKFVKKTLWQASDNLTAHQAALRALMGPIDLIMTQWKQGDKKADTSKIAIAVRTVLQKIDNAFNP
jgi:hypothetical protein